MGVRLSKVSYEEVKRFWRHVSYYSVNGKVSKKVICQLLDEEKGELNDCQMSWLMQPLLKDPYDKEGNHLYYKYPNIEPLLRLPLCILANKTRDSSSDDKIEIPPPLIPTVEQQVILALNDKIDLNLSELYCKVLLRCEAFHINEVNLRAMIETTKQVGRHNLIDGLFFSELYKVYCGVNDIPDDLWNEIFQYLVPNEYSHHIYTNYKEFVTITFVPGLLEYLLGYPDNYTPTKQVCLKDIDLLLGSPDKYLERIKLYNGVRAEGYRNSIPARVTLDIDENLLSYPPGSLTLYCEDNFVKFKLNEANDFRLHHDFMTTLEIVKMPGYYLSKHNLACYV